jgi:N-acetyl-anhydromuramyl-L-alanine amidase AmpD
MRTRESNALFEKRLDFFVHPDDYELAESTIQRQRQDVIVSFQSKFKTGEGNYIPAEWCCT